MQERGLVIRQGEDSALAIQELETRFAMAIRQRELLETYIKERLTPDKHFYKVGDSAKPSLTKEGAELICLPHNLKARYAIVSGPENPPLDDSPFQITVNCELTNGDKFSGQALGSASSMITRKDGTRIQRQKDPGLRHNATLKMACKSAYIAATLNSTAASEFFTQDLEDDQSGDFKREEPKVDKSAHWCDKHNTAFFMGGKMKSFAHPIKDANGKDTGEWCHESAKTTTPAEKVIAPEAQPSQGKPEEINWNEASQPATPSSATVAVGTDAAPQEVTTQNKVNYLELNELASKGKTSPAVIARTFAQRQIQTPAIRKDTTIESLYNSLSLSPELQKDMVALIKERAELV